MLLRPHGSRLWFLFVFLFFGIFLAAPLSMWDLVLGGGGFDCAARLAGS